MNIEIVKSFQPQVFFDEGMKLTKLRLKKNYTYAFYMVLIGIGFIIYDSFISTTKSDIIDCGFPLGFFLFATFLFFQTRQSQKEYKQYLISRAKKITGKTSTVITEKEISYTDNEISVTYQWSNFTHYRLIDNLIYLTGAGEVSIGFLINKSDLEAESLEELITFITNKLAKR